MEAVYTPNSFSSPTPFNQVLADFFKGHTPESTQVLLWQMFQCWALKDCKLEVEVTDEEVAAFFDQLIDLVAGAYIVHQANSVSGRVKEGGFDHGC